MYDVIGDLVSFDAGLTLLAPVVAIGFALATKRVIPSLIAAILVASFVAGDGSALVAGQRLMDALGDTLLDRDKWMITVFSIFVAATVGVMGRAGGTRALIRQVERVATGRRGAMVASWLSGGVVFFDDYANCLVVGSSMGPLCDRFRVSRAKLAYIVDATAAPVASLAVVSTWVGYEVGLFDDIVAGQGFEIFIGALPYRFYCLFTLVFVGAIAISGRDFGPMAQAERRAFKAPVPPEEPGVAGQGSHWAVAALPVGVLVVATFGLLVQSGTTALGDAAAQARLFEILGEANPYPPMFWGSLAALTVATLVAVIPKFLTPRGAVIGAVGGAKPVFSALAVLYLAWILGHLIGAAGTGEFLTSALGDRVPLWTLPGAVFLLAAFTAFSVGSSFFTMGALIPLVLPLALGLSGGELTPLVLASCAAVLDGAVLGDHASPISDTTILSSLGANVDVVTHVDTQLPYVLAVGAIAILCGAVPIGFGVPVGLCLPLGAGVAVVTVLGLGRPLALGSR